MKNLKISDFDPMRPRAGISTSEIHFIISKTVSAVRADATEVPTSRHKTSIVAPTVYLLQGGKVDLNFEKKISGKKFSLRYDQKNTPNPLVKSVFKSDHN